MRTFAVIVLVVLAGLSTHSARGQILDIPTSGKQGTGSNPGGAFYNFSTGSGCELNISVWGFVNNPGRYSIPCNNNLLDLLSYCGGPRKGAYLDRIVIVRRGGPDREDEIKSVIEIDAEKYLDLTDISAIAKDLLLWPGDLVIIDGEEQSTVDAFLRVAQVIVAITSIVTATIAVINIAK